MIGTAKPTPSLPPLWLSIWELIPITWPAPSISGPPELPGLIAASVWMTSLMEKPLGAWIWRWSAETIPVVTVRSSPNGLPIATTGSPTCTFVESPSGSGLHALGVVDLEQRDVGGRVGPDDLRLLRGAVPELHVDALGPLDDVGVGEDVPVVVDQEARACGGALLLLGEPEDGLRLLDDLRADEGDALGVALVDVVDREALARRVARGPGEGCGCDDAGRG